MPEKRKGPTRVAFIKDPTLSRSGFRTHDEALEAAEMIGMPMVASAGATDGETFRIRVRLRNRTGLWDVVVKRRTELPDAGSPAAEKGVEP